MQTYILSLLAAQLTLSRFYCTICRMQARSSISYASHVLYYNFSISNSGAMQSNSEEFREFLWKVAEKLQQSRKTLSEPSQVILFHFFFFKLKNFIGNNSSLKSAQKATIGSQRYFVATKQIESNKQTNKRASRTQVKQMIKAFIYDLIN